MVMPSHPLATKLHSLKYLLLSSGKLETFWYADRGQGTHFVFAPGEKLPAFKELRMQCYDWDHSHEDVEKYWDFSRLQKLELHSVPLYPFLSSINPCVMTRLRELRLDDYSAHLPDHRSDATALLHRLVRDHLTGLRVLCITTHTRLFGLDAVTKHASTLVELRLRDHVGFAESDRRCPTLGADDVLSLARQLHHLEILELDMDTALCDPPEFLRALCQFRRTRDVTLHVQTVLHPFEVVHPGVDRDQEAALRTFIFLIRGRAELLQAAGMDPGPMDLSDAVGLAAKTGNVFWSNLGAIGGVKMPVTNMCMNAKVSGPDPSMDIFAGMGMVLTGRIKRTTASKAKKGPFKLSKRETSPIKGRNVPIIRSKLLPADAVTTPFKSITINVGGWRRVMVRRLGAAWRQQNENGLYAERCFVLERGDGGVMGIREERCIESS